MNEEQVIVVNIPFTYVVGRKGHYSGRVINTIEDAEAEVLAEIQAGVLEQGSIYFDSSFYYHY